MILPPGLREYINYRPPNHSLLQPALSIEGKLDPSHDRIGSPLIDGYNARCIAGVRIALINPGCNHHSQFTLNSCEKSVFYSTLTIIVCTLLAQVVLTAR